MRTVSNQQIAVVLDEIADLLEIQHANPHRIRAYRSAAQYLLTLPTPIQDLLRAGDGHAIQSLPYIGERLSQLIEEVVRTGRSTVLERLRGSVSPEELFALMPGIGPKLAERIVQKLDIHTLEELEMAAHDGRLATIPGFGKHRIEALKWSLAGIFRRAGVRSTTPANQLRQRPPVEQLLEIDAIYRLKARSGKLRLIAPKRFNPTGSAWLPIMHLDTERWAYTVLYSNTSRAHELGKTSDWVVIYYEKGALEGQATVVTETHGPLKGKRVVRGRERECEAHYHPMHEFQH